MRWILSTLILFSAWWAPDASAQTPLSNEEIISERIGYYIGIFPVIRYLLLSFENAQTVAQKNEAVRLYQQFQLFYHQETFSRDISTFSVQMIDDFVKFSSAKKKPCTLRI